VSDITGKIQNYKTLIPRGEQIIYAISVICHNHLKQQRPGISDVGCI